MQGLHHTQMAETKDGATLQNKTAASKRLPGIVEDIQLLLLRQAIIPIRLVLCDVLNRGRKLGDEGLDLIARVRRTGIFFPRCEDYTHQYTYYQLRPCVCPVVKFRRGDVAQIPDESRP